MTSVDFVVVVKKWQTAMDDVINVPNAIICALAGLAYIITVKSTATVSDGLKHCYWSVFRVRR
jgi:hypothetical protein